MTLPVVVAGGGPAGAATATQLAQAGVRVVLLERTTGGTHKICGEFLSGEVLHYLARLGYDPEPLGGHRITAVRLVRGDRCVEVALPFAALGLSRAALDEALLAHAAAAGAEVRRGQTIVSAEGTALRLAGGAEINAGALFLATGKHDLRGLRRGAAPKPDHLVGFKMHFALAARQLRALSGRVELILFPDAYVGLQRVEGGVSNLCLLARRGRLERAGGTWDGLLTDLCRDSAHLRTRLKGACPSFAQPLTIARVPYGFVHRLAPDDCAAVFRLGDQAAVIPSFSGDGMSIALHSASLAARMFLAGQDAHAYHRGLRRDVAAQVRRAWLLQRLGGWGPGQAAMMGAAAAWPGGVRLLAAITRVPSRAMGRALA